MKWLTEFAPHHRIQTSLNCECGNTLGGVQFRVEDGRLVLEKIQSYEDEGEDMYGGTCMLGLCGRKP